MNKDSAIALPNYNTFIRIMGRKGRSNATFIYSTRRSVNDSTTNKKFTVGYFLILLPSTTYSETESDYQFMNAPFHHLHLPFISITTYNRFNHNHNIKQNILHSKTPPNCY
jgi:hypothetical protein